MYSLCGSFTEALELLGKNLGGKDEAYYRELMILVGT